VLFVGFVGGGICRRHGSSAALLCDPLLAPGSLREPASRWFQNCPRGNHRRPCCVLERTRSRAKHGAFPANTNASQSHGASPAVQRFTQGSAVTVSLGRRSREFLVNERRLPQYYARATHYRVTWLTVEPRGGLIAYANEGAVRAGLVGNNPLALTEFASAS
jgi:hypothetical protein